MSTSQVRGLKSLPQYLLFGEPKLKHSLIFTNTEAFSLGILGRDCELSGVEQEIEQKQTVPI